MYVALYKRNGGFIMYTWYREKYYFYEQEICSYICTQHFTREN